ncbi:MAG: YIP1 family protein [Actinomycetota bacterium]|nr:YIP1 family protein [Actinomycetota bacterium]
MDDRPQDRAEERRRRGPLGDEAAEETRRVPRSGGPGGGPGGDPGGSRGGEDTATRRLSPEEATREAAVRKGATRESPSGEVTSPWGGPPEDEGKRVIRPARAHGDDDDMPYTREERLRDVYGGVDWLASFVGSVFALLCAGVLLLFFSGFVLGPLSFTLDLRGREIDSAIVIGLVVIGVTLLISYFVGGYIAGRLVRFDGGRNGAATVGWSVLLIVIFGFFGAVLLGSFLPDSVFGVVRGFLQNTVIPTAGGLFDLGLVGAGIAVGAILLMLLGSALGGRLGNRYHTRIDETI